MRRAKSVSKDLDQAEREALDASRRKALSHVMDWLPMLVRFDIEEDSPETEATLP